MNRRFHFTGAAALALVLCLSIAPAASARQHRDPDENFGERIVRVLKKMQQFAARVASNVDVVVPPRP